MRFPAERLEQRGSCVPSQPGSCKNQDFQIYSLEPVLTTYSRGRTGLTHHHLNNLQRVLCRAEKLSDLEEVTEPH